MTLTRWRDVSAAQWLTASDQPWDQLVGLGPAGFPAYARLRFLPDPAYEGQSENDVELAEDAPSETAQLRAILTVLAEYTRTPADCYFCLWEGWRQQAHGDNGVRTSGAPTYGARAPLPLRYSDRAPLPVAGDVAAAPGTDPSARPRASHEPMVVLPNRAYALFRGTVADLGCRDSAQRWPGEPGTGHADPAFIWPADHAWCIANDVDPHWAGIGADRAAIDRLVADERLDVVRADPRGALPRYR